MEYQYEGDDIAIEEMPQGCIISSIGEERVHQYVQISSKRDALAIIDSLQRMIAIQFKEEV